LIRSLNIFRKKRRGWIEETVAATGDYRGLRVVIRGMPCLRDPATGRRGYVYPDFGAEFRESFDDAIGHESYAGRAWAGLSRRGISEAMAELETGGVVRGTVVLRGGDPIEVEVSGWPVNAPKLFRNRREQFDHDLGEAIVAAFDSVQLDP
jgi:hypothetical protein